MSDAHDPTEDLTVDLAYDSTGDGFPLVLVGSYLATRRSNPVESEPHA